jgi:sugar lactone lactonase YvrE
MPNTSAASVVYRPETAAQRFLPEGPYRVGEEKISWVAIQHGAEAKFGSLNLLDLASGVNTSYTLPGRPGFAFPCDDGKTFIVGCERQLGLFHLDSEKWTEVIGGIDDDVEGTIVNDGLVWEGNVVFGTKDLKFETQKAGLYLYRGRDKKLIRLRNDQICSNGKAIRRTAAGLELVDIDSPTRKIVAYPIDFDGGTIGDAKTLVDLSDDQSVPDGAILTPDQKSVIVSMYNPNPADHGETRQYSLADGVLQHVWTTPGSPQNTCPALVEHGGKVCLVISTAVEHMPASRLSDSPNAGCLFIAETQFSAPGESPRYPIS